MAMKETNSESQTPAKQPYEKPSFRYEQVFVTTALQCGKVSATTFSCQTNTKS